MDSTQPMARPGLLLFPDICAIHSVFIPGRSKRSAQCSLQNSVPSIFWEIKEVPPGQVIRTGYIAFSSCANKYKACYSRVHLHRLPPWTTLRAARLSQSFLCPFSPSDYPSLNNNVKRGFLHHLRHWFLHGFIFPVWSQALRISEFSHSLCFIWPLCYVLNIVYFCYCLMHW